MSDVGISGGAPSSSPSAPSQGEAVINPSPVNIPNPISNQVTDQSPQKAPPDSSDFKAGRRDTIAKAFERARTDPVPAQRAKPGMGDNKPPEPMAKEAVKAAPKEKPEPKLDLKKRPVEELPHEGRKRRREERLRGEHGHFAAQVQSPQSAPGQSQAGQTVRPDQPAPIVNPLPPHAPYREPPTRRMSPAAQRDWHQAPETVRADVHRMFKEFSQASNQMRGAYEAMKPIAPYHRLAQQHGTTLERALHNYTEMENKLRADPIGGIDVIVNNLNLRTEDGQRLGSRDVAYEILRRSPEQHQLMQSQNTQTALAQQLSQIQQRQQALEYRNAQMHHAQQFAHIRGQVDRFAETHPRLDELGPWIEQELKLGFDLPTAYRRAELLRPAGSATHAAQTRSTPAQTRNDRFITGAPDSSLNGGPRRQRPSANPREAVLNAMRVYGGR